MATTGILQLGEKRRPKGLGAWMGEMETSAIYPQVLKYATTPGYFEDPIDPLETPQAPGGATPAPAGTIPTPPAAGGSAALPTTQTTAAGEPGPTPTEPPPPPPRIPLGGMSGVSVAPPEGFGGAPPAPPGLGAAPATAGTALTPASPQAPAKTSLAPKGSQPRPTRTVLRLPEVFPGPGYLAEQKAKAEVTGDIKALQEAYRQNGDADWMQKGLDAYMVQHGRAGRGASSPFQAVGGEVVGPDGKARQTYAVFNRTTGQYEEPLPDGSRRPVPNFRPRTTTASSGLSQAHRAVMVEMGVTMQDLQANPALAAQVNDRVQEMEEVKAAGTTAARGRAASQAPLSTATQVSATMGLRDDWKQISTKVVDQMTAYSQMQVAYQAALRGDVPAGAEAMTVLFQKILDPNSVVRETEANRPAQFAGLSKRIEGAWQRLTQGGALITVAELKKYVRLAGEMTQAAAIGLEDNRARIQKTATDWGLNPEHIVPLTMLQPALYDPDAPPSPPDAPPVTSETQSKVPSTATPTIDWKTPLKYDPATKKWVQQ